MRVDRTVEVAAPLREVFDLWMRRDGFGGVGGQEAQSAGEKRARWHAEVGGGGQLEVRLTLNRDGRADGGEIEAVLRPLDQGRTEVEVHSEVPRDSEDDEQLESNLDAGLAKFKQIVEAGRGSSSGSGNSGSQERNRSAEQALNDLKEPRPRGRSPTEIGQTGRSDLPAEGSRPRDPGGRGAMAYGGRGDVGMPGRPTPAGDIAGEGRGSPGAPLAGGRGDTGGLGGQGRGLPAASRGGGESSGTAGGAVPPAEPETIQDNAAPATPDEGISNAGGAGSIGEEERIAGNALGGQGSAGRESMSTEGTPAGDQADRHGTEGSDKPSRYRGETRRPSGPDEADSDSG